MYANNPFTDRTFSGALKSSLAVSHVSNRHYFPMLPQKNTIKPGFLVPIQAGLPTVSSDMRSPYSSFNYQVQHKPRRQNVQNPFYKSHLLEDSHDNLYSSLSCSNLSHYSSIPSYLYAGTLQESRVTPVYTADQKNNNYSKKISKKSSKDQNNKFESGLKKTNSRPQERFNNQYNDDYKSYNSYNPETRPIIEQITTNGLKKPNSGSSNGQNQKIQKKSSRNQNSEYIPLNQEYPPIKATQSIMRNIYGISEHASQEDDPLKHDYPSFNSKFANRYDQMQSPTFKLRNSNSQNYLRNQTKSLIQKQTKSIAVGRYQNIPSTINYEGKTFYFVNVDQL